MYNSNIHTYNGPDELNLYNEFSELYNFKTFKIFYFPNIL